MERLAANENVSENRKSVAVDPSACVGCGSCMTTCAAVKTGRFSLSAARLFIERHDATCEHIPRICLQCEEAPCRDACALDAITEDPEGGGLLVVDEAACSGCGACEEACPHGGIRVAKRADGRLIANKCDQCHGEPACAKVCVVGALRFGGGE